VNQQSTTQWAGESDIPTASAYPANDTERAIRFAKQTDGNFRHVIAWNKWVVWDGHKWACDTDGSVSRKAQELPQLLMREATSISDFEVRKKAQSAAISAGNQRPLNAMITLAQCQLGIPASPTLFDSDPWLLGVTNGVVELRTGAFREARKDDYIIKQAGTAYDPTATCPTWEKFLSRVLGGDPELISFIQRAVGYSLTGKVVEQCLLFLYGTGQNGKSTFIECLHQLLGDYILKTTTALYTLDRNGKEPDAEKARLVGKRMVTGSETEEGAKLAESRVKDLTGGDTLNGRELYCPAFSFPPTHKIWIYGNHRPDVRGNDQGIWRRIKLVPFEVQIPDSEKDPELLNKFLQEKPGILNWAIRGCLEWQRGGLGEAHAIAEATAAYREDEDELGEFISESCRLEGWVERGKLYQAFKGWAIDRGANFPLKQGTFSKRISEREGIKSAAKTKGKRCWSGISLLAGTASTPAGGAHGAANGPFPLNSSNCRSQEEIEGKASASGPKCPSGGAVRCDAEAPTMPLGKAAAFRNDPLLAKAVEEFRNREVGTALG
jgi:putative DNA primase/helicase